jgi:hypothetical protein
MFISADEQVPSPLYFFFTIEVLQLVNKLVFTIPAAAAQW